MNTPLLDALLAHRDKAPAPFHMPGHKGRTIPLERAALPSALDVTELPDTGDLYVGGDVIQAAEALWAAAFGFPVCQFLTGGSTQGLQAALLLAARAKGREVLADRCSHRSIFNAFGLFDLSPTFLLRRQDAPVTANLVEAALGAAEREGREVKTVCVTSPTYYGVLSDIPAIAKVVHGHGALLVVDGAHGAHLPFLGEENPFAGADLLVCSAHKTLPVYGQGALLFAGAGFDGGEVRRAASVVGTSSPSYPVMAAMDAARAHLESREGQLELLCAKSRTARLAARFGTLKGVRSDPLRLTLEVGGGGFALKRALEAEGVFPEMADRDHIVFLCSTGNTGEDFDRLEAALARWYVPPEGGVDRETLPPAPEAVVSPAAALTAPRRRLELAAGEGLVCAGQVAPYPPGIPVIAPGERITKKCLAYLVEVGYNVHQEVDVLLQPAAPGETRSGTEKEGVS